MMPDCVGPGAALEFVVGGDDIEDVVVTLLAPEGEEAEDTSIQ